MRLSCQRTVEGSAGTCVRCGACQNGKTGEPGISGFCEKISEDKPGTGQGSVSGPVSDVLASGIDFERSSHTGGISAGHRTYAGAGTGLLSHAVNDFHLYVLYGCGSAGYETGLCAEKSA